MKNARLATLVVGIAGLLAVIIGPVACAHVPPPIANFGTCAARGVDINAILTDVESGLAANDFQAQLVAIGRKVGYDLVDCAVKSIMESSQRKAASAPSDTLNPLKVAHAQAWLSRR